MITYSFYRTDTGEFTGKTFSADPPDANNLERHTPEGCAPLQGIFDHLSQRVDLDEKRVVDFKPPAPGPGHEWSTAERRWYPSAETKAKEAARQSAMVRLHELADEERHLVRRIILDGNDEDLRKRLREIDDEINALREAG